MKGHYNIAIDGPSGAGKSTIAKMLAEKLGIMYLDTGALYRAIGLKAYRDGWPEDDKTVAELLRGVSVTVDCDPATGRQRVYLDGEDVSEQIRQDFVSGYGSRFSALPSVRAALLGLQRSIAAGHSSVLDGRDIGTHVLPDAKYKIFLTASVDIRARRRYNELVQKGQNVVFEKVRADIGERDRRDSTRETAPLRKAEDAVEINSDELSPEEVAEKIIRIVNG